MRNPEKGWRGYIWIKQNNVFTLPWKPLGRTLRCLHAHGEGKVLSSPFSGKRCHGKGNALNLKKTRRQLFQRRQQEMDILTHLDGRKCRR